MENMGIALLRKAPIFEGITDTDVEKLVNCLNPEVLSFQKNELICSVGEHVTSIAFILSGSVRLFSDDYAGNIEITAILEKGEMFGDICAIEEACQFTARAASQAQIMFIEYRKLSGICRSACEFHIQALVNMFKVVAAKNSKLLETLQILRKRTTREKLLAYLYIHAKEAGSTKFNIPLNRAALADYLRVDRSAMSRELCAMRDEGMLEFYKSSFILLNVEFDE
jgi:CRP-like cAMP-binding protein